ncbi:hypothetical protein [Breznakiella homolactica]|nr:hypothetical protein [Breznakiella homolactica]
MRKLVFILIAFIAAATFIRAYDNTHESSQEFTEAMITISPDH